jgi:hypothetical protein
MPRLQITSPLANMSRECQEHFYPTQPTATTELGYRPLSIETMSGLFTILAILSIFSTVALLAEILWHRQRNNVNYKLTQNATVEHARVLHIAVVLRDDQPSDEVMDMLREFMYENHLTMMLESDV